MNKEYLLLGGIAAVVFALCGCDRENANEFQGYIEGEYVYVAAPLGGALEKLAVARGDTVTNGQLLFLLERQSEKSSMQQAADNLDQARSEANDLNKGKRPSEISSLTAQLQRARASLELSQIELVRREDLSRKKVVSTEELDQARAQRDSDQAQVNQLAADLETGELGGRTDEIAAAHAQVEAATAALAKARWSVDQKQQFSPVSGPVQDTLYRQGEYVSAGSPVVVLLPPDHLKVRFFVPEEWVARVKVGAPVQVKFDGAAKTFPAEINYISTQAEYTPPVIYNRENRASLVYMIEGKFAPSDAADLRPGQPVDVTVAP